MCYEINEGRNEGRQEVLTNTLDCTVNSPSDRLTDCRANTIDIQIDCLTHSLNEQMNNKRLGLLC